MRELIVNEIRRLAAENGGKPPGVRAFSRQTGITESKWAGVYWARWSDALSEAEFAPNEWQRRLDSTELLLKLAEVTQEFGKLPTEQEMQLRRTSDRAVPDQKTLRNHFTTRTSLVAALRDFAEGHDFLGIIPMLPETSNQPESSPTQATEGGVYLLKSGNHYKIGRSDQIERRVREISCRATRGSDACSHHTN